MLAFTVLDLVSHPLGAPAVNTQSPTLEHPKQLSCLSSLDASFWSREVDIGTRLN